MEAEKPLSEIARAILVNRPDKDPKGLREKAGLLALLDLLGIVEAFYGVTEERADAAKGRETAPAAGQPLSQDPISSPASEDAGGAPASSDIAASSPRTQSGQASALATGAPDSPFSVVSALAKLIASAASAQAGQAETHGAVQAGIQSASQAGTQAPIRAGSCAGSSLGSLLAGLDPALIASMIGVLSGIARPRSQKPPVRVESEAASAASAMDKPEGAEIPAAEDAVSIAREAAEAGAPAVPGPLSAGAVSPGEVVPGQASETPAGPPSPIQQLLGIDPRVLTLVLNVAAELMKSKAAEKEKAPGPRSEGDERPAPVIEVSAPAGRSAVQAGARRNPPGSRPCHRPGLGIYRSPSRPARLAPVEQAGTSSDEG